MQVMSKSRSVLAATAVTLTMLGVACSPLPPPPVNVPGSATIVFPLPEGQSNIVIVCVDTTTAVKASWTTTEGALISPAYAKFEFNGANVGSLDFHAGPLVSEPFGPGCGTFLYSPDHAQHNYGPSVIVTFEKVSEGT